ncbi:hypothetical protein [Streptomyces sp. NPDC058045]|uniref:hypothetical protein n=1 Tax=Streptomyces sp. NPDC058045 TaxID=3346311 RepID=UPI0036F0C08B
MLSIRSRSTRLMAGGLLSAGLLAGGAIGATAASAAAPAHPATVAAATTAHAISIKAVPTTVTAGNEATFVGHASGMKQGDVVTLEHQVNGTWQPVTQSGKNVSTTLNSSLNYSIHTKPTMKGMQLYRVAVGNETSAAVNITVN